MLPEWTEGGGGRGTRVRKWIVLSKLGPTVVPDNQSTTLAGTEFCGLALKMELERIKKAGGQFIL